MDRKPAMAIQHLAQLRADMQVHRAATPLVLYLIRARLLNDVEMGFRMGQRLAMRA